VYAADGGVGLVAAPVVEVVDTTGAGDAFLGALALALARGSDLRTAVSQAVAAGAESAQQLGATASG
jgi:ribokinase